MRSRRTRSTRRRIVALAVAVALALAGCGDDQDSPTTSEADDMPEPTTTPEPGDPTVTGPADPPTDEPDGSAPETTDPPGPATPEAPRPYASFTLEPAAAGSNPLLEWEPVEGATLYRLVVLDAAGEPYWAWSGAATATHLGASEEPTAIGARVFEPMTWQVSAYDDGGTPLAFSDVGTLSP